MFEVALIPVCVQLSLPSSSLGSRPSNEAKLWTNGADGPGARRNPLRQAGQRVCPLTCQVCREPEGGGREEQAGTGPALGDRWMLRIGEPGLPIL